MGRVRTAWRSYAISIWRPRIRVEVSCSGALLENLALKDILGFFENDKTRKAIFSPTHSFGDQVLHGLTGMGPKYSSENKLPALQNVLPVKGPLALSDAALNVRRAGANEDLHILITGFDYDRNRATFFRSAPASGPQWGSGEAAGVTLAEAIHASTNAPVNYFDAPADFPDRAGRYWDGAIAGCNNPVLVSCHRGRCKNSKQRGFCCPEYRDGVRRAAMAATWRCGFILPAKDDRSKFYDRPAEAGDIYS